MGSSPKFNAHTHLLLWDIWRLHATWQQYSQHWHSRDEKNWGEVSEIRRKTNRSSHKVFWNQPLNGAETLARWMEHAGRPCVDTGELLHMTYLQKHFSLPVGIKRDYEWAKPACRDPIVHFIVLCLFLVSLGEKWLPVMTKVHCNSRALVRSVKSLNCNLVELSREHCAWTGAGKRRKKKRPS